MSKCLNAIGKAVAKAAIAVVMFMILLVVYVIIAPLIALSDICADDGIFGEDKDGK